ncbi:MAG TPA: ABC-F family ATP-binding cassette domain-containing protein, partial [Fimbriimonadaceae bacterium]|nr:ABC-F family ATP-binding cassette domain-containing protein [Fimbriimonadaceae bacterium]
MLLSVSNVAKAFGVDEILTGISFLIAAREKVALVGRNGTGKTTLLKILTGRLEADTGTVNLAQGAKIGYLRQEAPVTLGRTVLEEAQASLGHQLKLKRRLEELEGRLSAQSGPSDASDLEEYALLHEHFLEAEGYSAERDIRVVLQRMGFSEEEFARPTDKLSGGEKTRLAIARMLLEEPDLLILDEPTNHLDLQATEWLEGWLRQYHGAVLLVSHDREFLENTAERVLELRDGTVKSYPGPFPKYLKLKEEEEARQAEVAKRQEQEIAKLDEYVRRFMNSQRTAQARGRLKQMNRLIENKVEAPKKEQGMKGGFGTVKRSGDIVVECEKLAVGFSPSQFSRRGAPGEDWGGLDDGEGRRERELVLFQDLDWTVRIQDRWGVIGENGAGKSSLIKTVLGLIPALAGRSRLGSNLEIGYFSQDTQELDPEQSPLDFMVWECDMLPADARNLLGRFLFSGDDVYRPIRTLSGGEKNKLSLARLTHQQPNLLILDEPTNHLDMDSREALAGVLKEFRGTLILISHDRWLLSQVTDHTLDVRRAGPVQFNGSYPEYRLWQKRGANPSQRPAENHTSTPQDPNPRISPREL